MLTEVQITRLSEEWNRYTPRMKEAFRKIARETSVRKRRFSGATVAALRRRRLVFEYTDEKTTYVTLTEKGCFMYEWLKTTRQLTRDKA